MSLLKLLVLLLLIALPTQSKAAEENIATGFRPATSETEKTLEYILDQAAKYFNIGGNYDYTNTALSAALLAAIKEAQNHALTHNCSGTESLGTNCGLKYNPVTCNIDIPLLYYFSTIEASEHAALIDVSENPDGAKNSHYKLVYDDHEWKIDSIRCANGDNYNFD